MSRHPELHTRDLPLMKKITAGFLMSAWALFAPPAQSATAGAAVTGLLSTGFNVVNGLGAGLLPPLAAVFPAGPVPGVLTTIGFFADGGAESISPLVSPLLNPDRLLGGGLGAASPNGLPGLPSLP